jgi:tRNA (guanine37-N1)-methyltransferase
MDVVTLFPALVEAVVEHGIPARARERGLLELVSWNPRDFATDRHRTVDDRPYGGGPGMVMKVEPLAAAIQAAKSAGPLAPVLYMSPQGKPLDQAAMRRFAELPRLVVVCGRYEGIDERLIETEIDEEWSLGDYVLSGGELAAMVVVDAIARLLPGALGHVDSAAQDSFSDGLLDCPHYTRPEEIGGLRVPEPLLTGNHAAIERWRRKQALGRTWLKRPDLLARLELDEASRCLLNEFIDEYRAEHRNGRE